MLSQTQKISCSKKFARDRLSCILCYSRRMLHGVYIFTVCSRRSFPQKSFPLNSSLARVHSSIIIFLSTSDCISSAVMKRSSDERRRHAAAVWARAYYCFIRVNLYITIYTPPPAGGLRHGDVRPHTHTRATNIGLRSETLKQRNRNT